MPVNPVTERVLHTTFAKWRKKLSDATVDFHPLISRLKAKGQVEYGCSGALYRWTPKTKQRTLIPYGNFQQLDFTAKTVTEKAELPWRGYKMVDAIGELELLSMKGMETVVKIYTDQLEDMRKDAMDRFNAELYNDGNLAGNELRLHGVESLMKITPGSQVATDEVATVLADTYAEISTAYNAGDDKGPWSPVIINANQTSKSFAVDADELVRRGLIRARYGKGPGQSVDVVLLTKAAYLLMLDVLQARERVIFSKGAEAKKGDFGFTGFSFDGVDVMFDPDIPATDVDGDLVHGYGFTTDLMRLCVLGPKKELWGNASGSAYNEQDSSFRWWLGMYGQLVFEQPRSVCKFADIS